MHFKQTDIERFKGHGEKVLEKAKDTALTCSTVAAFSLAAGRLGPLKGVPLDLVTGLVCHGIGVAAEVNVKSRKKADKVYDTMAALGDGALASYFARIAHTVGTEWKATGKLAMPSRGLLESMAGDDGGSMMGGAIADQELARMVAAGRR